MDKIYDESGIVIGEAREKNEPQDMYWCTACTEFHAVAVHCTAPPFEMPDILDDEILPTSGIKVEEHRNTIERNHFVLEYLLAKEKSNVNIRECW